MITAIIIDDEKHCIETLKQMIQDYCNKSVHVIASAQTVGDGIEIILKYQPQLVFLDIQIYDKSGFDLLKQLPEINFEVIFTTAYDKYAVEAFNFSAIHYLLKPIEADKLKEAVERMKEKISREDLDKKLETLSFNLNQNNTSKRIAIPTGKGYDFIQINDIIRCEADGGYSNIYVQKRKFPFKVAKTLSYYDDMLNKYDFCRCHQSHLVNMRYVKSFNRTEDIVKLKDGSDVPVSNRLRDDFLKALKRNT